MEAILFVGHGSRDREGNEQLLAFTRQVEEQLRRQSQVHLYETCFLELTTPTIRQGIARCVERGASRVAVVPLMLFSAGHAKLHIPHELDEARAAYPHISFHYGRPVGVHEGVLEILLDRLAEAELAGSGTAGREQSAILLVGRGSSDADANSDLYKLGRLLYERAGVAEVEFAFMGVTRPTLEEGLARCLRGGAKQVVVLPYLLFTGVLINRMKETIASFSARHPEVTVACGEFLGFHQQLKHIIADRALEALNGRAAVNCDMCQYRKLAAASHHHHHHHHHHDGDDHGHHHHHHDHHDHDDHHRHAHPPPGHDPHHTGGENGRSKDGKPAREVGV